MSILVRSLSLESSVGEVRPPIKERKLVVLGTRGSGKSTFVKQMKTIVGHGFIEEDFREGISGIHDSIVYHTKHLIESYHSHDSHKRSYHRWAEPVCCHWERNLELPFIPRGIIGIISQYAAPSTIANKTEESADFVRGLPRDTFIDSNIAAVLGRVWADLAIQCCFDGRSNLSIPDNLSYFLNKIEDIGRDHYLPDAQELLLTRVATTGVTNFHFDQDDDDYIYTVFDVGGARSERVKWIHVFDAVDVVICTGSLAFFDQTLYEDETINAFEEQLNLFHAICHSRYFRNSILVLVLAHIDIFEQKLQHSSLKDFFPDYQGRNNVEDGVEFIKRKFWEQMEDCKYPYHKSQNTFTCCLLDQKQCQNIVRELFVLLEERLAEMTKTAFEKQDVLPKGLHLVERIKTMLNSYNVR